MFCSTGPTFLAFRSYSLSFGQKSIVKQIEIVVPDIKAK